MHSDDAHDHTFLIGLFCGAIVGASVALLLAPAPGREARAWAAAKGRAAGRRTAQFLDRRALIATVRQHGVRGLLERLNRNPASA